MAKKIIFNSPTHNELIQKLPKLINRKLSIIDYGCGEGELLNYLDLSKIKSYIGYDVTTSSISIAKKYWSNHKNIEFELINKKALPNFGENNSLDFIFLIGVAQYLTQKEILYVLQESYRALKPGGKIFITCSSDHFIYKFLNIYRFFIPNSFINRNSFLKICRQNNLEIEEAYEKGLFLTPLFSNVLVFFFDALDKLLFKTQGKLGPIGRNIRSLCAPLIRMEYLLKIDYGYTLFVTLLKNK